MASVLSESEIAVAGEVGAIESDAMKKLLMVCMGNICRSPMAQAVGQKLADDANLSQSVTFYSAGTHTPHAGMRLDARAEEVLLRRGYALGRHRSRKIDPADFENFDLILAMDARTLSDLQRICPSQHVSKVSLLMDFAEGLSGTEVPDPYYGNLQGFERVLDLCEAGVQGLLKSWR